MNLNFWVESNRWEFFSEEADTLQGGTVGLALAGTVGGRPGLFARGCRIVGLFAYAYLPYSGTVSPTRGSKHADQLWLEMFWSNGICGGSALMGGLFWRCFVIAAEAFFLFSPTRSIRGIRGRVVC